MTVAIVRGTAGGSSRNDTLSSASGQSGDQFASAMAEVRSSGTRPARETSDPQDAKAERTHRGAKKIGSAETDPAVPVGQTPPVVTATVEDTQPDRTVAEAAVGPAKDQSSLPQGRPTALSPDELSTLAPALHLLSEPALRGDLSPDQMAQPAAKTVSDPASVTTQTSTAAMMAARAAPLSIDRSESIKPQSAPLLPDTTAAAATTGMAKEAVAPHDGKLAERPDPVDARTASVGSASPGPRPLQRSAKATEATDSAASVVETADQDQAHVTQPAKMAPAVQPIVQSPSPSAEPPKSHIASAPVEVAPTKTVADRKSTKIGTLEAQGGVPRQTDLAVLKDSTTATDTAGQQLAQGSADRALELAKGNAWLDSVSRDIAATADTGGTLRFQVAPQQLGTVDVALKQGMDGASVTLTASTEKARDILSDARPQLLADASAQGLRISSAEVDVGGQASSQSQHRGQTGHQHTLQAGDPSSTFSNQTRDGDTGRRSQTGSQLLSAKALRNPSRGEAPSDSGASDAPADGLYA